MASSLRGSPEIWTNDFTAALQLCNEAQGGISSTAVVQTGLEELCQRVAETSTCQPDDVTHLTDVSGTTTSAAGKCCRHYSEILPCDSAVSAKWKLRKRAPKISEMVDCFHPCSFAPHFRPVILHTYKIRIVI